MPEDNNTFFIVWSPEWGHPKMTHNTRRSAEREAERLAIANPGRPFFTMRAEKQFSAEELVIVPLTKILEDSNDKRQRQR